MIEPTPPEPNTWQLSLDDLLDEVLPEIKLALGAQIDRENARALPGRYARLLPETLLVVTLRPDAAEALTPVAAEIERELTDSCTRHGSLYDRVYRVELRRSADPEAPLFAVSAHAGHSAATGGPASPEPSAPAAASAPPAASAPTPLPAEDPDATRAEGVASHGWNASRWMLVVEDERGDEQEVFRLLEPFTTVGRRSDDPELSVTVALGGAPHLSRRQLALVWDGGEAEPAFQVYNLGLNPLHVGGAQVPGARLGRGSLRLEELAAEHSAPVVPEEPVRIGDHGPTLRIREVPAAVDDPDATQFG